MLFIWQRQIETFQMVGAVPLVPDYETVDLMEMAMSDNRPYLERFYADLRQGKYDLIVTMKQGVTYQGPDEAFPEENNVWVRQVQAPLMTYYEELRSLDYSRTWILKPRPAGAQTGAAAQRLPRRLPANPDGRAHTAHLARPGGSHLPGTRLHEWALASCSWRSGR